MRAGASMGQVPHCRQRSGAASAGRGSADSAPVRRRSSVPLRRPRPAGLPRGRPPSWLGVEAPRRHPRRCFDKGCSVLGQRRSSWTFLLLLLEPEPPDGSVVCRQNAAFWGLARACAGKGSVTAACPFACKRTLLRIPVDSYSVPVGRASVFG